MQPYAHQNRGAVEHPRHVHAISKPITIVIVAAVVYEQRIVRVVLESLLRILWRHCSGLAAVTGLARAAVAGEGLLLEQPSAFLHRSHARRRTRVERRSERGRPSPRLREPCVA